jgi:predicted membrane-bound spermidine synthase
MSRPARTLREDGRLPLILICFFLSGATGLVYQVVWLRMLGLVFGHTVYAVTTVLAAFMGGLALGSYLFARASARIRNLLRAYAWLEIGIGAYCALMPFLVWVASAAHLSLHRAFGFTYDTYVWIARARPSGVRRAMMATGRPHGYPLPRYR